MVGSIDIETFKTACVKYLNNKITVEYIDIPKPQPRAKRTLPARSGCPQTDDPTVHFDPCSIFNIEDLNNALDLIMTPQMEKVCDFTLALPCEYSDEYAKWFDTACALKGDSGNNFLVWMLFSSKSDKFNYNDIETYFEMWDEKILSYDQANEKFESGGYTLASICQWVKDGNPEQFAVLQNKYSVSTPVVKASPEELNSMFDQVDKQLVEVAKKENDKNNIYNSISFKKCRKGREFDFATFFNEIYPNKFIYTNDTMYYYDGVNWQQDDKKKCCYTSNFVGNQFRKVFEDYVEIRRIYKNQIPLVNIIEHEILKKEIQAYREITDNLAATSFRGNIVSDIKVVCCNPTVEFDTNGDLFCFKNKIFNLKTEEWIEKPDPKYYNTISTGYDWQEPKDEDVKTIKDLIAQIFPHEDERTLYMTILATGLVGQTLEKFIIANGCGGNGKGVIDELTEDFFGDYAYNCANYVLLNPIKDGNNPTVANMSKKRIIFYREPNDSITAQLNMGSIKELTGGNKINARLNYSNDTKTHLCGTHILEANGKPKISGKIDDAAMRRLIDIPFRSKFTKDFKDCFGDHVYDVNVSYKTAEFRNKYKCCMFKILLPYWSQFQKEKRSIEPFICQSVIDRTNDYLESSDEVKMWFDEHYEQTKCPTDIIKIADVYELFQQSSLWDNMTKKERRTTSKKTFIKDFSESVFFRKFYKEDERSKAVLERYNVSRMRNIIVGFKQIEDDIEEENRKLLNEMATKIGGF
jgi:phage/plasmid-associated DNA primase